MLEIIRITILKNTNIMILDRYYHQKRPGTIEKHLQGNVDEFCKSTLWYYRYYFNTFLLRCL